MAPHSAQEEDTLRPRGLCSHPEWCVCTRHPGQAGQLRQGRGRSCGDTSLPDRSRGAGGGTAGQGLWLQRALLRSLPAGRHRAGVVVRMEDGGRTGQTWKRLEARESPSLSVQVEPSIGEGALEVSGREPDAHCQDSGWTRFELSPAHPRPDGIIPLSLGFPSGRGDPRTLFWG